MYQFFLNQYADIYARSFIAYGNGGNDPAWIPHPDLIREDADVSLFLLAANSVYYDGPVSDPFFSANIQRETVGEETQYWAPDYYITALACIDQYQLCNPSNHLCTNLNSSNSIFSSALQLSLTSRQELSASRIGLSAATLSMFSSTEGRGKGALRASDTLFDRIQIALPDNQWMIEVSSWMAISLARLQYLTVQFATGPQKMPPNSHIVKPSSATGISACKSQKVRNATGTISFSVLGLSIILTIGGFLIITSLFLSHIINLIGRKFHIADYKCIQWALDEKFQLQRLAYEEAGQGTWSGALSAVPITKSGEVIGIPNGIDRDHPRLSKSREESGGLLESSKAQAMFEKNRPGLQMRTISSDLSHR